MVLNCTDLSAFQYTANQSHCKITKEDINKFARFTQMFDTCFLSEEILFFSSKKVLYFLIIFLYTILIME